VHKCFDAHAIWAIMPAMFTRSSNVSRARQPAWHSLSMMLLAVVLILEIGTGCDSFPAVLPTEPSPSPTRPPMPTPTATLAPSVVAFPTVLPSPTTMPVTPSADAMPRIVSASPVAQLLSPLNNAQISLNQTFNVVVYAADDHGIARLELFVDGMLLRSETPLVVTPVFTVQVPWTPTQTGAYVLRVVAYDATNRPSNSDEATVNVVADARKPSAQIVYPIGTPQIELGEVVQIHASATDEAGVTQLELWVDNQLYTYAMPSGAPTQFAVSFAWQSLIPGTHTLFARARDTQEQTTDSAPVRIFVANSHAPIVQLSFERTHALVGEPITVTITALDAGGIQRVELLNGKDVVASSPSGNPAKQTVLTTQVLWQSANPGDYSLSARAISASNVAKESSPQIVSILRPNQATPTPMPSAPPTRTRTPRATATAVRQPPPAPSAELIQPSAKFTATMPIRVTFAGKANAELDRIELWAYALGQSNPQIACTVDARAATTKTAQCDWMPPSAGVWNLYAQAVDTYRQTGKSALVSGYIGVPALPLPSPILITFSGKWSASAANTQYSATFRQSGTALRGEFKLVASGAPESEGRITSGAIRADRVTFHVDFPPVVTGAPSVPVTATLTTTSPAITGIDFDCGVEAQASALTCTFKDSRGRSGNVTFRRE